MIYDQFVNIETYRGIMKSLDAAIDFLTNEDYATKPDGKHHIQGDDVVLHLVSYDTKNASEIPFETHKKYIDIQFVINGEENCMYAPMDVLKPSAPFDDDKDVGYYEEPSSGVLPLPLTPGSFALFFPHDPHKPSCSMDGKKAVRKAVVKVLAV